eukprot:CAMPEP_0194268438 /NCGR_PEP_ID=MMETSP0169-20130528/2767_1 /TAXON_ID=218684 /ORGANISM="Corethron pennatum, Strain L29A3" /LENGTH=359 /DNA_ID=CAMNT_0039009673 /DNA_START=131 /DNA_END=1210 /DNA_ORIENTATION=-
MTMSHRHMLYDMPVSNNGARCRIIIYKKNIENEIKIESPMVLGGLKAPSYLALNPQGKMPLLVKNVNEESVALPESDTICRYLLEEYREQGPSFLPTNSKSNLISRLHDTYLGPLQGALYKAVPPFSMFGTREAAQREFSKQMQIIDDLIENDRNGPYLLGSEVSLADATLFPTMIFAQFMLPKFGVAEGEALPPKIQSWYQNVMKEDPVFGKVHEEVLSALQGWDSNGRWDSIRGAGVRDLEPQTIFDKIIAGDIPASIVHDDGDVLAFKDINPAAPAHLLVIPKHRNGLSKIRDASPEHIEILGKMMLVAGNLAKDTNLGFGDGARLVINDSKDGGQEVPHLHIHVLGGRQMLWPPG